ncbi:MAG TPA: AraC family transcriptional regulator [Eudoraea sp.]|nr:AraC family transcriptional regulator [Eudoraea sp.]
MEAVFFKDLSLMINVLGAGNCFMLSYAYIRERTMRAEGGTGLLSLLFFIIGIVIFNTLLNLTRYGGILGAFEPISNALSFAIAPLLYLQMRSFLTPISKYPLGSVHLYFFYAYLLFTVLLLLFPGTAFGTVGAVIVKSGFMVVFWNANFLIYLLMTSILMRKLGRRDTGFLRIIFSGILSIWLLNFIFRLYRTFIKELPELFYLNITLLFSVLMLWLSYQRITAVRKSRKAKYYRASHGNRGADHKDPDPLAHLIYSKRYYRDADLDLRKLARKLGLPYYQLSSLINHKYHQNFNEFINRMRIEEVVNALLSEEHHNFTIMGLAQRAGFNSGSAFYSAFKKETGTTPKRFLQKMRDKA